jgi:predicted dehydrogenase
MAAKLGVAIIGAGSIAAYHLEGLRATGRAALRVIVARHSDRARALATRFAVPDVSTEVNAVIERRDVDAVVIATPDDTHETIALRAIAAGKPILVQKPFAPDSAACRRIMAAAERAGVDVQVSFMHRHFEEVVEARQLIAAGAIGRVLAVRLRNATPGPDWDDWFFDPARVPGGVVHQLGIHGIDLLIHLFGPIYAARGHIAILQPERRLADGRVAIVRNPDNAWAQYELDDGVVANHEMSMTERQGCDRFRMEIYGEAGTIWLRSERGALAIWRDATKRWETPALASAAFGERQHRLWLEGIAGDAPREATARDAHHGMLAAEALLRSAAATGRREAVAAA